jgi:hypothetical protein
VVATIINLASKDTPVGFFSLFYVYKFNLYYDISIGQEAFAELTRIITAPFARKFDFNQTGSSN